MEPSSMTYDEAEMQRSHHFMQALKVWETKNEKNKIKILHIIFFCHFLSLCGYFWMRSCVNLPEQGAKRAHEDWHFVAFWRVLLCHNNCLHGIYMKNVISTEMAHISLHWNYIRFWVRPGMTKVQLLLWYIKCLGDKDLMTEKDDR
jgi:hypothetical protein